MDFTVQPRSLSMFRAEQMLTLSGSIRLDEEGGKRRVVNGGELELRDAILIDQAGHGSSGVSAGWARSPRAQPSRSTDTAGEQPPERVAAGPGPDANPFLAELRTNWEPREENQGELRLVAWVAGTTGGQVIEPAVDRHRGFTAVLVHLRSGSPPSPDGRRYNRLAARRTGPRGSLSGATERPAGARSTRRPSLVEESRDVPATATRLEPSQTDDQSRATARDGVRRFMIEVINFTKRYGDFVAVDNLSFAIGKGEIFGFIGPNGAGKSTTIRFLATLLRPTSGEGRVAGFSVTTEPMSVRRVIGFMPDDFGVYDGMKVWEFLDFFAVAYEIPRSYRKKIIGEVLDLLDLTHKRDDYVNGLSKGMKQRLCLAKTLVHDPPVLILDEPASGLDPRARLEMKALLNELKQMGKTILISSHILSELADFCTSIGIIERGKMLAAGNIQEIQAQIRSHRVLEGPRPR